MGHFGHWPKAHSWCYIHRVRQGKPPAWVTTALPLMVTGEQISADTGLCTDVMFAAGSLQPEGAVLGRSKGQVSSLYYLCDVLYN